MKIARLVGTLVLIAPVLFAAAPAEAVAKISSTITSDRNFPGYCKVKVSVSGLQPSTLHRLYIWTSQVGSVPKYLTSFTTNSRGTFSLTYSNDVSVIDYGRGKFVYVTVYEDPTTPDTVGGYAAVQDAGSNNDRCQ